MLLLVVVLPQVWVWVLRATDDVGSLRGDCTPSHSQTRPQRRHPSLSEPQPDGRPPWSRSPTRWLSKWLSSQSRAASETSESFWAREPSPHSCLWSERLLWTNYLLDCVGFQSVRTTLFVMLGMRAKIISWAWLKSSTTPLMTHGGCWLLLKNWVK